MLWINRHSRLRNQLSAYIDGQLSPNDAQTLEAHLETCNACRRELDELRAVAMAIRDLPRADAPRSFALTPERAGRPSAAAPPPPTPPVAVGMRLAGAALAFALAIVLVVDVGDIHVRIGSDDKVAERGAPMNLSQMPSSDINQEKAARAQNAAAASDKNRAQEGAISGGPPAASPAPSPEVVLTPQPTAGGPPAEPSPRATSAPEPAPAAGNLSSAYGASTPTPASQPIQQLQNTSADQLAREAASESGDGGLSTIRTIEIALAVGLAATIAAALAAAIVGRRRSH